MLIRTEAPMRRRETKRYASNKRRWGKETRDDTRKRESKKYGARTCTHYPFPIDVTRKSHRSSFRRTDIQAPRKNVTRLEFPDVLRLTVKWVRVERVLLLEWAEAWSQWSSKYRKKDDLLWIELAITAMLNANQTPNRLRSDPVYVETV